MAIADDEFRAWVILKGHNFWPPLLQGSRFSVGHLGHEGWISKLLVIHEDEKQVLRLR
jgi:hypothetical protein